MSKSHTQRTRIHPHKACQKSVFLRAQLTSAWTTNELMQQSLKKSTCFFTSWCAAAAAKHTRAKLCALKIPPSSQLQRSKLATSKVPSKEPVPRFLSPNCCSSQEESLTAMISWRLESPPSKRELDNRQGSQVSAWNQSRRGATRYLLLLAVKCL